MFDTVAKRYDLTNDLMTAGIQRTWRRAMVDAVAPQRGDLVLDLAAGTGSPDRGATASTIARRQMRWMPAVIRSLVRS